MRKLCLTEKNFHTRKSGEITVFSQCADLKVVSDKITGAFSRSGATRPDITLDISKAFDRV